MHGSVYAILNCTGIQVKGYLRGKQLVRGVYFEASSTP